MQTHASPKNINSNVSNSSSGFSNPSPMMQGQIPSQLEKQNNLNDLASNSSKGKKLSSLQESANKKTERNAFQTPSLNPTTQVVQCMNDEEFFAAMGDAGSKAFSAADAFGAFDDVKNGAAAVQDYVGSQAMGLGHHLTTDSKAFKGTGAAGRYHQLDGKDANSVAAEKRKEQLDDKEAMKTNPGWHLARKAGETANDMIGESAGAAVDAFGFGIPGLGSVASEVAKAPGKIAVGKLKERSMLGTNPYEQLQDDDDVAHKNEGTGKEGFFEGAWRKFRGK